MPGFPPTLAELWRKPADIESWVDSGASGQLAPKSPTLIRNRKEWLELGHSRRHRAIFGAEFGAKLGPKSLQLCRCLALTSSDPRQTPASTKCGTNPGSVAWCAAWTIRFCGAKCAGCGAMCVMRPQSMAWHGPFAFGGSRQGEVRVLPKLPQTRTGARSRIRSSMKAQGSESDERGRDNVEFRGGRRCSRCRVALHERGSRPPKLASPRKRDFAAPTFRSHRLHWHFRGQG